MRAPLYSLRYAGAGTLPEQAAAGAAVASVQPPDRVHPARGARRQGVRQPKT